MRGGVARRAGPERDLDARASSRAPRVRCSSWVCHGRRRRLDVEGQSKLKAELYRRWRSRAGGLVALRSRPAGDGCKPPRAAAVKSRGGERRGKSRAVSAAGVSREGERKRSTDDVSKEHRRHQNRGRQDAPGGVWREPADWPGGARHEGGASSVWAPVRNVGTCRPAPAGDQWRKRWPAVAGGSENPEQQKLRGGE